MSATLFGVIPAGQPLITQPTSCPSITEFIYAIPSPSQATTAASAVAGIRPYSHLVVMMLPGVVLPLNTAAAIYLCTTAPGGGAATDFKFLGGVGPGKESAIFKIGGSIPGSADGTSFAVGISVQPADSVAAKIAELSKTPQSTYVLSSTSLVRQPSTLVLAQRIIQSAFNFLASFSGTAGSVEVVPLKAFEDWWRKFESRVRSDPTFLERDPDG